MGELTIHLDADDRSARLRLTGDLDVQSVPRLRLAINEAIDLGAPLVELDMSDVGFVDSTGLGVLIGGYRRAGDTGQRLVLVGVSPALQRVLNLTGVAELLLDEPTG